MKQFRISWTEEVQYECEIYLKEDHTPKQVKEIFKNLNEKGVGEIVLEDGCKVGLEEYCMDNGEKISGSMAENVTVDEGC